jgi:hypothetical protein
MNATNSTGRYTGQHASQLIFLVIMTVALAAPLHLALLSGAQSLLLSSLFHDIDLTTLSAAISVKSTPFAVDFSNAFAWKLRTPLLNATGEDITINAHLVLGIISLFGGFIAGVCISGFLSPKSGFVSAHYQSLIAHFGEEQSDVSSGVGKVSYFMRRYFSHRYTNDVNGFAYMGAALLIVIIGLRGLKIIPSLQPTPVIFAISLEFCLLMILGITMYFTPEDNEDLHHTHRHAMPSAEPSVPTMMYPPILTIPEGTLLINEKEKLHVPHELIREVMMDIMRESMDSAKTGTAQARKD